jgi:hypothetical protein
MHSRLAMMSALALAALVVGAEAQQRGQRLPASMPLENTRAANLTALEVSDSDGKVIGRLTRPLAAGKKASLRLTKGKGCEMTVRGQFDDDGEIDDTVNFCREKVLRFRD